MSILRKAWSQFLSDLESTIFGACLGVTMVGNYLNMDWWRIWLGVSIAMTILIPLGHLVAAFIGAALANPKGHA